jgi:hypothetical protein
VSSNPGKNIEPEWTERADKRGLDPLGMQNAGVALYQSLLPGISNVTLRMRYYGYYCWVSDAYARPGATTEFAAWQNWVRRAEALYALVAAHAKGQGGVGGVEWADRRLAFGEDVIDFTEAASNDKDVIQYLLQSLGVFGGAYYSQMAEVGLFRQGEHGIQRATNGAGKAAADAFGESIGREIERILIECIRSARITREDLNRLAPIIPSAIPELSSERAVYERLLFAFSDVATANDASRATSLKLILTTADSLGRKPDPEAIRWHLFSTPSFNNERLNQQRVRWEAYQCQDLMQVAAAALLEWATDLMAELEAGRTLAEIEAEVRLRLEEYDPYHALATWSEFHKGIEPDEYEYRAAWSRLTSRRGIAEDKVWDAVWLLAALKERIVRRPDLREAVRHDLACRGMPGPSSPNSPGSSATRATGCGM